MPISTEKVILSNLAQNRDFAVKVGPHLKPDYFFESIDKSIYCNIDFYIKKYKSLPKKADCIILVQNDNHLNDEQVTKATEVLDEIYSLEPSDNQEWINDMAESFCVDKSTYIAIQKAINIYQGEDKKYTTSSIPDLLKEAISVSFTTDIGIDFFDDVDERLQYYKAKNIKIPFHLNEFNEITGGGIGPKTLNIVAAGTNVGKTMVLCDFAANYLKSGLNVLYITQEMASHEIMKRIDANLFDVPMVMLKELTNKAFRTKVETIKTMTQGKLKVVEYPPHTANSLMFESLLDDLKIKKGFKPDVLIIDYLTITNSSKLRDSNIGSYFYYKSVAEELRSVAVNANIAVWSAAQLNRGSLDASDVSLSGLAESMAIAQTADFLVAILRTPESDNQNQMIVKQLKSRYANRSDKTMFAISVDWGKQKLLSSDDVGGAYTPAESKMKENTARDRFGSIKVE